MALQRRATTCFDMARRARPCPSRDGGEDGHEPETARREPSGRVKPPGLATASCVDGDSTEVEMTEAIEERLANLGLRLPEPAKAVGNYVGAVRTGNLVFVSGHGPFLDGKLAYVGRVDSEVAITEARAAAELVVLNCLRSLRDEIGSLDRVARIVRLFGMVNSDPSFTRQPEVIDGASDFTSLFGPREPTPGRQWGW